MPFGPPTTDRPLQPLSRTSSERFGLHCASHSLVRTLFCFAMALASGVVRALCVRATNLDTSGCITLCPNTFILEAKSMYVNVRMSLIQPRSRLGCKWSLVQIQSPRHFEAPDLAGFAGLV